MFDVFTLHIFRCALNSRGESNVGKWNQGKGGKGRVLGWQKEWNVRIARLGDGIFPLLRCKSSSNSLLLVPLLSGDGPFPDLFCFLSICLSIWLLTVHPGPYRNALG